MRRLGVQILIQVFDVFHRPYKTEGSAALRTVHAYHKFAQRAEPARHLPHLPAERTMFVQCEWIHLSEFSTRRLIQS